MKYRYWLLIVVLFSCTNKMSSEPVTELETREVTGNLKTVWEVLWGPDNHLWITERYGRISRINPESGEINHLITISSIIESGERGLMGMILHPDFQSNPYVYVVYNYGTSQSTKIRIERYTYDGNILTSPITLLENIQGASIHDGARIIIGSDYKLWFTIGDAGNGSNAQNLTNVNGKLSRMNLDGSVPDDNPFPESMIWSYGHRNQQGMVFANGKIYTSEHGASTNDEINIIQKGRNYGWSNVEGYCDTPAEKIFCQENNVVERILSLTPTGTLAIAGIDFYNHDLIPEWKNSILITALKTQLLLVAKLDEAGENVVSSTEYFNGKFGRLRDVCVAPDGRVFIATSNRDGRGPQQFRDSMDKIIEIKPAKSSGLNTIDEKNGINVFPNPSNGNFTIKLLNKSLKDSYVFISDSMGKIVRNILETTESVVWDGKDDSGNSCPNGIYNAVIRGSENTISVKLVLIR